MIFTAVLYFIFSKLNWSVRIIGKREERCEKTLIENIFPSTYEKLIAITFLHSVVDGEQEKKGFRSVVCSIWAYTNHRKTFTQRLPYLYLVFVS
jgi:hypothetical protein